MTTTSPTDLEAEVTQFAGEVATRVLMCLEGEPKPDDLTIRTTQDRYVFGYCQTLHASAGGEVVGHIQLDYAMCPDRSGRHMAVHSSAFKLKDRRCKRPIIRLEYVRDAYYAPSSHVHVHGESGLLTELLAATGHKSAAAIDSIHVPTGGDRFRPCIEDFVEFLIQECGIAARDGWRAEVLEGRERFRSIQTAAAVRDRPEIAIEELTRLGLRVTGDLDGSRPTPRSRY